MSRIVIAGAPRSGKTTLARSMSPAGLLRHTDDLIATHSWSEASQTVSEWFDAPGPWIIEGVTVSRALRKWRAQHPGEPPPVDRCIFLSEPYETLTGPQLALAIGVETIHSEIAAWLREHDVAE